MSEALLNEIQTDETELAEVLQRWIAGANSNSESLTAHSLQVDQSQANLEGALHKVQQQAVNLHAGANQLAQSSQRMISDLTGAQKNLSQDLERAADFCQKLQMDLTRKAKDLEGEAQAAARALVALHGSLGVSMDTAGKSRQNYAQATQGQHRAAHEFLGSSRTRVSEHGSKMETVSRSAASQLTTFHGELDLHLKQPIKAATDATGNYLSGDLSRTLTEMVRARLQTTLAQVNQLTGGVQKFTGEFGPTAKAMGKLAGDVARDIPEMVRRRAVEPIVNTGRDLVVRQLVNTMEAILVGVGLSTAMVGAMPVLKVVSAALRLMMDLTNLIQHGELRKDQADKYIDDPIELAKSLGVNATGQNVRPGLADLVDSGVLKVDGSLALVALTAQKMKDELQDMVNRGAEAAKEFIEDLFCPICHSQCELVHA